MGVFGGESRAVKKKTKKKKTKMRRRRSWGRTEVLGKNRGAKRARKMMFDVFVRFFARVVLSFYKVFLPLSISIFSDGGFASSEGCGGKSDRAAA